jgi:nicotinate-nucleotide--dimethylbenzimidazole phosphoribosyltransferase
VSAYPREVTAQLVANFLHGGAAISVLANLLGVDLWIVDAGVAGDCSTHSRLIDAKIRPGTRNFIEEPAMTPRECADALQLGSEIVGRVLPAASNTLVLGEMGIGNTASAAMLMHGLTGRALVDCIGRGTGLDDKGLERKKQLLGQALKRRALPSDPLSLLAEYGGYEIAMLIGAIMAGAARRALILVDGFTVTVAVALAAKLDPSVLNYCVFGHCSAEHAHRALLQHLRVQPLLDLGMRLGEEAAARRRATGCAGSGVAVHRDGDFEGAGVSNKDRKRSTRCDAGPPLLVAIQFLTRLPVPHFAGFQTSWLSESARFFRWWVP